jgi:1-acyl-sn-glycerol-3-phosphate acyltransferase
MLPIFLNSPTHSSLIVRMIRVTRIILHTLYGVFLSTFILTTVSKRQRNWIISYWSRRLLHMMNIQVSIHGTPPTHDLVSTMFVGNHISWLDIHVLNSIRAVRFIAKAEIRHWPVFGWLATQTNTLFIEREQKKDAVRVINTAAKSLMRGDCLCFFPEGTTTDGTELLTFKGSLIQAPINAKAKVWPFVIEYPDNKGEPNQEMAFTGETTLLASIWQIVSLSKPQAIITFLPIISPEGHERRGLTIAVRHAIAAHLNMLHH